MLAPVLFHPPASAESAEARARRFIRAELMDGRVPLLPFSGGKDSSSVASLVLTEAARMKAQGLTVPPIVVLHSDTTIENPTVRLLAQQEMAKMRRFASEHRLSFRAVTARPPFNDRWAIRVLGGRALPPFPDTRRDCTTDWKIRPIERLIRQTLAQLGAEGLHDTVLMTGVRAGESAARDVNRAKRGETHEVWSQDGDRRVSPILRWSADDVFEYLGSINSGLDSSYSDFGEVIDWYRDAGGGCVVVSAMAQAGPAGKPCSARAGCWGCTMVQNDHSLEQLLRTEGGKYAHLRPLNNLRNFLSATQYDWSRRTLVGRTIDADGYIAIKADGYNAKMLQDLLRYTLTAQSESGEHIIGDAEIVGIDARWSLYALARPFTAIGIYLEWLAGARWPVPTVARSPKTPPPDLGRLYVGGDWSRLEVDNRTCGLTDAAWQMHSDSCGPPTRQLPSGAVVMDLEDDAGEPDAEACALFLDFEAEDLVAQYRHGACRWTDGYRQYLRMGLITVGPRQTHRIDAILRRSDWRQANELHGHRSMEEIASRLCASTQAEMFA